jgi:hypothetical protein
MRQKRDLMGLHLFFHELVNQCRRLFEVYVSASEFVRVYLHEKLVVPFFYHFPVSRLIYTPIVDALLQNIALFHADWYERVQFSHDVGSECLWIVNFNGMHCCHGFRLLNITIMLYLNSIFINMFC